MESEPRFAGGFVTALEKVVRDWSREAVGEWLAAGAGDFIPVAELVPARVIGDLLGLPEGDASRFRTWAMIGGDILAGNLDVNRLGILASEALKMSAYLGEHLDRAGTELRHEAARDDGDDLTAPWSAAGPCQQHHGATPRASSARRKARLAVLRFKFPDLSNPIPCSASKSSLFFCAENLHPSARNYGLNSASNRRRMRGFDQIPCIFPLLARNSSAETGSRQTATAAK